LYLFFLGQKSYERIFKKVLNEKVLFRKLICAKMLYKEELK